MAPPIRLMQAYTALTRMAVSSVTVVPALERPPVSHSKSSVPLVMSGMATRSVALRGAAACLFSSARLAIQVSRITLPL